MIVNDNCINLIKSFEGLILHPYHGEADRADVFTIGYGTTHYLGGVAVSLSDKPITAEAAEQYLRYEVEQKAKAITKLLRTDLTDNQFGSLVSFAYNLGEGSLQQSTLRAKVNKDPKDKSIENEFLKWIYSNGKKQPGLIRRRQAESKLYFT